MRRLILAPLAFLAILLTNSPTGLLAQNTSIAPGDWTVPNRDAQSSRYTPLDEINTTNVAKLTVKWQLDLQKPLSVGRSQPIVIGGIMYFNSGPSLVAVDAASGKMLWNTKATQDFPAGGLGPASGDGRIYGVGRSTIAAFNAENGAPVTTFGNGGLVNPAKAALEFKEPGKYPADFNPETIGYSIASSPTYANGTLFIGLASSEGLVTGGFLVALDGATGKVKWAFRGVPQGPQDEGWELAKDTWSSPLRRGGGIWSVPAVDPALGMVYVNVSNPSSNYDGSNRKGSNLFTNSLVALDMNTGKLKWHFQVIHHDLWDWDLVSGPTLFETMINGKPVKAIAALPKTCMVYAFNRETGKPLFPIVETAVPTKTDVPNEEVYPTQPIPFNARNVPQTPLCATFPPYVEDPALLAKARPMFTPPSSKEPLLISPGALGGPNRGAPAFSPKTGLLYVTGKNDAMTIQAKPLSSLAEPIKPGQGNPGHFQAFIEWKPSAVKATQNIAAYNPAIGDLAWVTEVPGTTGSGSLVTAGNVVFHSVGRELYALDASTGAKLAQLTLKAGGGSSPISYRAGGKQLVTLAGGSSVVALGLP
jgi:glucose dehydrogenase